ncbi:Hypothetical predicted protein [Marmota monax]|uniref:Uncharacterized protein n=1 Tax=Marmota monax TaxID=9995 RepID=A0A5E4BE65_MARMO|nr:Hypothetical predicted protein [Marmota monax]
MEQGRTGALASPHGVALLPPPVPCELLDPGVGDSRWSSEVEKENVEQGPVQGGGRRGG